MDEIQLTIVGSVATVTLAAPARRNALTPALARDLARACDEIDANADVGAVVVTGEGGFCAGAARETLSAATADPLSDATRADLGAIYESFARVGRLSVPSVAAITGAAVGAGVNLALATDLRVIATDARLIPGFLRLGLHPGGGHLSLLGRLAGREAVAALGMFGEEVDGVRAQAIGLAWEAVPSDQVLPRSMELAGRAARDPELARAVCAAIRLELGPPAVPWPTALAVETGLQAWSLQRAGGQLFRRTDDDAVPT